MGIRVASFMSPHPVPFLLTFLLPVRENLYKKTCTCSWKNPFTENDKITEKKENDKIPEKAS